MFIFKLITCCLIFGVYLTIEDIYLCRFCGELIVKNQHILNKFSPNAINYKNYSINKNRTLLLQYFRNPEGIVFDLATYTVANVVIVGMGEKEYSWFNNYVWSIVICPRCKTHLGWFYNAFSNDKFFGIIFSKLVPVTYAAQSLFPTY